MKEISIAIQEWNLSVRIQKNLSQKSSMNSLKWNPLAQLAGFLHISTVW